MKGNDFKHIYDHLKNPNDVKALSKQLGLDEELLTVIFTQKTVRETTKKFYRIQRLAPHLLRDWKSGKSMLSIALKHEFPPILTGMMIFQANGCSKKVFWKHVREPNAIEDQRVKRDIIEITEADCVYSPWANETQYKR
ncbi:MAG TPA: hypothetical protein VEH08_05645 [Methanomassiliicoccales archaeon]|nr:hypothetical protein [Methanomassiliicoccales archaeon]